MGLLCEVDTEQFAIALKEAEDNYVNGLLFVDELARETPANRDEDVKIIQYPESPGAVL